MKIRFGRINESFHQVAAAVVEEVLLRLGHEVEVHEGPHPEMYPKLASGEHHLFADAWLPGGHAVYWEQVKDAVVEVATLYEDAEFFWAVPGYVPEAEVSSLRDLAKPEVHAKFPGKVVQGTTSAAGLTMRGDQLLETYGLKEQGWTQPHGDIYAIIDTIGRRYAAGEWFVTPLWQPMYLNQVYQLRPLTDPEAAFPEPDRASLLAHRESWEELPEQTRTALQKINYRIEDVNEMDLLMNQNKLAPLEAVREWTRRHPGRMEAWLA
ncbi:glycine betaine transporter periplasmic subunit [Corynebacterium occultum]|uniref:Glycine betaine transporter periplasmic subunit n=1 Tax=Corynebacterium occultum TaxID=2675219 RepID=A0A6B8WJ49_9CORY|nr:glycine betaine ABC transporter substrate-binding protein [Corynebacterium occultum]QGU06518.1 glycine betaine transporter periplasmic subunit [Corynebacterium occultum]